MTGILVVAPHADDETYGCGGTLLRARGEGQAIHWLIVTFPSQAHGYSQDAARSRTLEIERASEFYGFASVHRLGLAPAALDRVPRADLVAALRTVVSEIAPGTLYLPFPGDAHSDHRAVFEAGAALAKRFRHPSIRSVRLYETPSETDFGLDPTGAPFRPNLFIDISETLAAKIEALGLYPGECGEHPFPRSVEAVRALAIRRGAAAGVAAAEAFMILREIR
ncbi:MAG: PIG-L deacetylase family protein [Rhodothalassiaceae bacterium]